MQTKILKELKGIISKTICIEVTVSNKNLSIISVAI